MQLKRVNVTLRDPVKPADTAVWVTECETLSAALSAAFPLFLASLQTAVFHYGSTGRLAVKRAILCTSEKEPLKKSSSHL